MAIVMPAVAIVIATPLHRGARQHEDDAQKAGDQGFLHVMALSANLFRQRFGVRPIRHFSNDLFRLPRMLAQMVVADDTGRGLPRLLWSRGFAARGVVFGRWMKGLFRWASVSDEDGIVRRVERIWRLGAAGFGTPENEGPCRGLNVACWGAVSTGQRNTLS